MTQNYPENIGLVESRFQSTNDSHEYTEIDEIELISNKKYFNKRIGQTFIDFICILVTFAAIILVHLFVQPTVRGFYCNDAEIFKQHMDDTVKFWIVVIYGTFGPIIFIILIELMNSNFIIVTKKNVMPLVLRKKLFFVSSSNGLLIFLQGLAITLLITELGKRWVGRLRPHFMNVCLPIFSEINCTTKYGPNTIFNYIDTSGTFCTNDESIVKEARLSFPSGHSSFSTYCMLFLIIYIQIRWHSVISRFLKVLIQMTAFIAAYVTCLSRISDHHHHGTDVFGGVVIGCVIAFFMFFCVGRELIKLNHNYHKKSSLSYNLKI